MLVGASGSILTKQMAEAMNRSIGNVFFSGFGAGGGPPPRPTTGGTVRSTSAADVAIQLSYARLVVVVPGYGMAVAQAQRAVADLAAELERRGVEVLYAIHPVAGRMPGHMNVLLAEADVPYEQLKEMDEINGEFARTDVALVIGANDVTNPAARNVADSPIYGMPILDVDKSQLDHRPQALDVLRLRGHRQPALLRREDLDAVRRRQGLGRRGPRRGQRALEAPGSPRHQRRDRHRDEERRAAPHQQRGGAERGDARVDDDPLAVGERLHHDQRGQQRDRQQRQHARDRRRGLALPSSSGPAAFSA